MNKITHITFLLVMLSLLSIAAAGCSAGGGKAARTPELAVIHEEEFGGVYITLTIDDFNSSGFAFGDSIDIDFSNGIRLRDIPYYNGYYAKTGETLLVGYPGYPYVDACIQNGDPSWEVWGLKEGDTATISLSKKGKYLDIQNARDIHYTDERSDYADDIVFANFRNVRAGDIRPDLLSLYSAGNVMPLSLKADYGSGEFRGKLANG